MNKINLIVIYFYYFLLFIYINYKYTIPISIEYFIPCCILFIFTTSLVIITIYLISLIRRKNINKR